MKKTIITLYILGSTFAFAQETQVKDSIVNTKEIQEVLIKSQRKKQFVDKSVYTFDPEALEKARYAKDLLTTLPELQLDPVSNTVASIKGGKILFLINGIEASDNQIKSIAPNNVAKVEYYDIPPARWAQRADTVVNIITKNPENGYSFGAELTSAFTTGFVNSAAYADITRGKNNFGLEYNLNLRNYNNRIINKRYEYDFDNVHYISDETQKDHFGYTTQNITTRYSNSQMGKYAFQAKLKLEINNSFSDGNGTSIFNQGSLQTSDGTIHNRASDYVSPTLDLYYSKNLGQKDELSLNVVGSHYDTNSTQYDREWNLATNEDIFNNDMILKAKQNGFVGEIAHTHQFEKGKLSSGYRLTNNAITNDLKNLAGSYHYKVNYLEQYLYSEYSGKKNKFSYRLGMGFTFINNKSAESKDTNWSPAPKVILGYELAKNQNLRLQTSYTMHSASSDAMSSNVVQVVPNIVQYGNPNLKTYKLFHNNLQYSFNNKYFDFNAVAFFNYMPGVINQFFINDTNGYAISYENSKYTTQLGLQVSGSVKPFGNSLLALKTYLLPVTLHTRRENGTSMTSQYISNNFVLSSEYKSFSFFYQFNFPVYILSGAFNNTNENQNHFLAKYKIKDWTLSAGIYWIGHPSEYKSKSLQQDLVNYSRLTQIHNNKNMVVAGISYDFSTGKKAQIQRKLNNSTAPAATF